MEIQIKTCNVINSGLTDTLLRDLQLHAVTKNYNYSQLKKRSHAHLDNHMGMERQPASWPSFSQANIPSG